MTLLMVKTRETIKSWSITKVCSDVSWWIWYDLRICVCKIFLNHSKKFVKVGIFFFTWFDAIGRAEQLKEDHIIFSQKRNCTFCFLSEIYVSEVLTKDQRLISEVLTKDQRLISEVLTNDQGMFLADH